MKSNSRREMQGNSKKVLRSPTNEGTVFRSGSPHFALSLNYYSIQNAKLISFYMPKWDFP